MQPPEPIVIMKQRLLLALATVGMLFLGSEAPVSGQESKAPKKPDQDATALEIPKGEPKAREPLPTTQPELPPAYKLVHQDKVKYTIEEDPVRDAEFPELIVTSLGQLTFPISRIRQSPLISILAVGKTLEQVKAELVAGLEAEYYHKATVNLQLTSKSERFGMVTFVGPIIRGQLKLNPGEQKKLSDAIVEKSYTDFANLRKVEIIRSEPGAKKAKVIVVDVDSILHKGRKDLDQILEDGDTIRVPEKGLVF